MSEKYKFHNPDGVYFTTSTITAWVNLFTKPAYCEIILDSLKFCQKNKGLVIHAWCLMSNHLHLIISRNGKPLLHEIMRDFKRYTSLEIIKAIEDNNDSRKKWMLDIFKTSASKINRVENYKVWKDGNHPIELDTNLITEQKLNYIHDNPVIAGFVWEAENYVYSSAIDYSGGKGLLDVEF
jgi:REP element-mobilizing transposase RayT